jgi:hypothetical protein
MARGTAQVLEFSPPRTADQYQMESDTLIGSELSPGSLGTVAKLLLARCVLSVCAWA